MRGCNAYFNGPIAIAQIERIEDFFNTQWVHCSKSAEKLDELYVQRLLPSSTHRLLDHIQYLRDVGALWICFRNFFQKANYFYIS